MKQFNMKQFKETKFAQKAKNVAQSTYFKGAALIVGGAMLINTSKAMSQTTDSDNRKVSVNLGSLTHTNDMGKKATYSTLDFKLENLKLWDGATMSVNNYNRIAGGNDNILGAAERVGPLRATIETIVKQKIFDNENGNLAVSAGYSVANNETSTAKYKWIPGGNCTVMGGAGGLNASFNVNYENVDGNSNLSTNVVAVYGGDFSNATYTSSGNIGIKRIFYENNMNSNYGFADEQRNALMLVGDLSVGINSTTTIGAKIEAGKFCQNAAVVLKAKKFEVGFDFTNYNNYKQLESMQYNVGKVTLSWNF